MILTPMPVYYSITDTPRKVMCKFEVNQTNGSRVITFFVPAPQFLTTVTWCLWPLMMSTPPESASGSRIVVQAPINVLLLTYDWNAQDQMWEFRLFKHQFHILEEDLPDHVKWGGLPSLHPWHRGVCCHGLLDALWSCRQNDALIDCICQLACSAVIGDAGWCSRWVWS